MTNFNYKALIRAVGFCLVVVLLLSFCNYALFNDSNHRRVMMHEMYTQESNIDLAILGGSVAYINIDPQKWDETLDFNSFNLGSDTQSPDATYYLLKELLRYHKPQYCIYSTTYIAFLDDPMYDNPTKDHILFDYFRPSLNKVAYWLHAFDDKTALEAVLPFLREKNSLTLEYMKKTLETRSNEAYCTYAYSNHNTQWEQYEGKGFLAVDVSKQQGNVGRESPPAFREDLIDPMKVSYFQKLVDLCKKNDCELIMVAPPIPYAAMTAHKNYQDICDFYTTLAQENGVQLFDFTMSRPDVLPLTDTDFYDHVHMNGNAAKRFSEVSAQAIGQYIHGDIIDKSLMFYKNYQELLDASPYIFNTWLEPSEGGYLAQSTYGTGVISEYRFSVRDNEEAPWECLQEYGKEDFLPADSLPEDTLQIKVEARPRDSREEYQQYDIYTLQ